jgi:hypothetical protein
VFSGYFSEMGETDDDDGTVTTSVPSGDFQLLQRPANPKGCFDFSRMENGLLAAPSFSTQRSHQQSQDSAFQY